MKRLASATCLIVLVFACTGCGYLEDRGRDAMDIFTFTVGTGAGATARVGPVHAGLYFGDDYWGLKGGEFRARWRHESYDRGFQRDTADIPLVLPLFGDVFCFWGQDRFDGTESMALDNDNEVRLAVLRGKRYCFAGQVPFVYSPALTHQYGTPAEYYTQLEVAVGVGVTVRAGFNVGEFADFVLGWFGIDIYGDDVSTMSKEAIAKWAEPRLPEFSWDALPRGVFALRKIPYPSGRGAIHRQPPTRKPKSFEDKYSQFERVSRNGKLFLGCTHEGRVEVWDLASDRKLFAWDDFVGDNAHHLKGGIHPNGQRVAVGNYDKILVWDVKSGKQAAAYDPRNGLRGFLSAGQAWYALCYPRNTDNAMLVDLDTRAVIYLRCPPNPRGQGGSLECIRVRPDDKTAVCIYYQSVSDDPKGGLEPVTWLCTFELPSGKIVGLSKLASRMNWWINRSGEYLKGEAIPIGRSTKYWKIVPVDAESASKKPEPTSRNKAEQ